MRVDEIVYRFKTRLTGLEDKLNEAKHQQLQLASRVIDEMNSLSKM
jgi:hypothetical protein